MKLKINQRVIFFLKKGHESWERLTQISASTHLIVQEYEVHLDEDKGHSRGGREGQHNVVALGVLFQLEVLAEFQSGVDHRTDAERHGAHSQIEATVVLNRTYRIHVRASGLRRVAVAAGAARRSRRVQIAHVFLLLCSANLRFMANRLIAIGYYAATIAVLSFRIDTAFGDRSHFGDRCRLREENFDEERSEVIMMIYITLRHRARECRLIGM